ncbi:MAG: amidohydrolase [Anaerolineaceae bacterium]|nr:amidohydrolase [Anaerolineaceae bacterium]
MILLINGRIGYSALTRQSSALAVDGDRILAIGSDAQILALATPNSQTIDLAGQTVLPGLTDAHLHMGMYSDFLQLIDCEVHSMQECLQKVKQRAAKLPADAWVLGHGWNQNTWQGQFGTAAELDAVSKGHPAFLTDKSLHSAWVNTAALRLAGIDASTPDPVGGIIQRDATGAPTGILFETAVLLVENIIPSLSPTQREQAYLVAQSQLISFGLTSVHDFDSLTSFETLLSLHSQGKLLLRVCKSIPFEKLDWAIEQGIRTGDGDDQLRWGSLKLFADGALGPQTAAMLRPYAGSTDKLGKLQLSADDVFETGIKASSHGISLAVHAIGDRATHEVLNGFGMLREYEKRHALPRLKHRIEHVQLLHPDNLKKAAQLDLVASMQPVHATSDMFTADLYWQERCRYAYAWKTLADAGTTLVYGSDAPVESPNPFWGIHAAVTRRRQDGSPSPEGWYPQEKISLQAALDGYTKQPAALVGFNTGALQVGKFADLLIIQENLDTIESQQLFTIQPQRRMLAGKWVG